MTSIQSETGLQTSISELEHQQRTDVRGLKDQFQATYESVQPINVLKRTVTEALRSHELRDQVIGTAMGLAAGYIAKLLFERGKHGALAHVLGTALQFGITTAVLKNPEFLAMVGKAVTELFTSRVPADDRSAQPPAQLHAVLPA